MSNYEVVVKGQEIVMMHLRKLADPQETFDTALKDTAIRSRRELQEATLTKGSKSTSFSYGGKTVIAKNMYTGDTSRAWSNPFKINDGYAVTNDRKTADGKHLIAEMLEKGREEITPKTKKVLYFPLTRKGQAKSSGAKPIGLEFMVDYILVPKVKSVKGRNFMDRITMQASHYLTRSLISEIRKVFTK